MPVAQQVKVGGHVIGSIAQRDGRWVATYVDGTPCGTYFDESRAAAIILEEYELRGAPHDDPPRGTR